MASDEIPGFEEHRFKAQDDLQLYARDYGADTSRAALPIVCLPGLSRNSRDFHQLGLWFSTRAMPPRRVITLDYRGRGQSDRDSDAKNYQLPIEARDVLTACAELDIDKAAFIGTSRGGLILHLLGAMRPELLAAVVLNDIGPVIETQGLVSIRHYLEAEPAYPSFQAAAKGLKMLHGPAFPALSDEDWTDMADAIFTHKEGKVVADFDPALIEPLKSITLETPLPDLWALFDGLKPMPLMVIRGENSTILSKETVAEMQRRHRGMTAVIAGGQGHAPILHIEPLRTEIERFLQAATR